MKLSEAIREGAKKYPQTKGEFLKHDENSGSIIGCCALGAAGIAVFDKLPFSECAFSDELMRVFPELEVANTWFDTPITLYDELYEVITTLNDIRGWSREQIADWLESIGH